MGQNGVFRQGRLGLPLGLSGQGLLTITKSSRNTGTGLEIAAISFAEQHICLYSWAGGNFPTSFKQIP
jgi:hypothetical protein